MGVLRRAAADHWRADRGPVPHDARARRVRRHQGCQVRPGPGAAHGRVAQAGRARARVRAKREGHRLGDLLLQALLPGVPARLARLPRAGQHRQLVHAPLRRGGLREEPRRVHHGQGREAPSDPALQGGADGQGRRVEARGRGRVAGPPHRVRDHAVVHRQAGRGADWVGRRVAFARPARAGNARSQGDGQGVARERHGEAARRPRRLHFGRGARVAVRPHRPRHVRLCRRLRARDQWAAPHAVAPVDLPTVGDLPARRGARQALGPLPPAADAQQVEGEGLREGPQGRRLQDDARPRRRVALVHAASQRGLRGRACPRRLHVRSLAPLPHDARQLGPCLCARRPQAYPRMGGRVLRLLVLRRPLRRLLQRERRRARARPHQRRHLAVARAQ
mmetsp:Transcript_32168/g.88222  ORF Transcript_32168/g.88222 Transcript_32168/m.88222 type:complete len:392 (+) Transcript_32168:217-1392(+)